MLDFGFLLDVEFLIINGEKGNVIICLIFWGGNGVDYKLESFKFGLCENMVLGIVDVVVMVVLVDEVVLLVVSFEIFIK